MSKEKDHSILINSCIKEQQTDIFMVKRSEVQSLLILTRTDTKRIQKLLKEPERQMGFGTRIVNQIWNKPLDYKFSVFGWMTKL